MSSVRSLRNRDVAYDHCDPAKSTKGCILSTSSPIKKVVHKSKKIKDLNLVKSTIKRLSDVKTHKNRVLKMQNIKENFNTIESSPIEIQQTRCKILKCITNVKKINDQRKKVGGFKINEIRNVPKNKAWVPTSAKENQSILKRHSIKSKDIIYEKNCVKNNERKFTKNVNSYENNKAVLKVLSENHCPIWNKNLITSSALQQIEKIKCISDIYDIAEDEEIMKEKDMISEPRNNKCKKKSSKKIVNVKNPKKKQSKASSNPISNKNCNLVLNEDNSMFVKNNSLDKLSKIISKKTKNSFEDTHVTSCSTESINKFPEVIHEEIKNNAKGDHDIPCSADETTLENPCAKKSNIVSCMMASKCENNKGKQLLLEFIDDFEKSFTLPKMTSTPDKSNVESKDICLASKNVISEISGITYVKHHFNETVMTPTILTPKKALNEDNPSDNEMEITLFDSPSKSEFNCHQKKSIYKTSSPVKSLQINLFEENLSLSPIKESFKRTGLKHKKDYHTPVQFRRHLVKSTKIGMEKRKVKTKEDRLIEKVNKEFEDISSFEMCIE